MSFDDSTEAARGKQASVQDLHRMALDAWQGGDLVRSVTLAAQVLGREPEHVGSLEMVGVFLLQEGKVSAAYGPLKLVARAQALNNIAQCRFADVAWANGHRD